MSTLNQLLVCDTFMLSYIVLSVAHLLSYNISYKTQAIVMKYGTEFPE